MASLGKIMPVIVLNLNSISMKSIFWISFNLFVAAVSKKKPFKDLDVGDFEIASKPRKKELYISGASHIKTIACLDRY